MANVIKYNTSTETLALNKGNFWIGVGDVGKGPTSTTGFYNGITPPYSGYTIYINKASGGPSIYTCTNDTELISLTNSIANTSYTTSNECLTYYASQSDKICTNIEYEQIMTDSLVLNLDAGFTSSYPKNGTTIYDLSGNGNNCTLTNGITFNSNGSDYDGSGTLTFDGSDDYIDFYAPNLGTTTTVEMWCKIGTGYSGKMFMGWGSYDIWCTSGTIGYNTGNGDLYGISQNTVNSLGIVEQWAHYIFEFNSNVSYTNNKIYINGVSQSLSQITSSESSGNRNFNSGYGRIGGWRASNGYLMPMDCAVFRVYNRPLSQSEITQNYNAFKGRYQNFFTNGNFQFLTSGGALQNFNSNGATVTVNTTTVLPGHNYSLQLPQTQYNSYFSDTAVQVDTTKTYVMTVTNRTLTKGGSGNDVLSAGHTGFYCLDSSFRGIYLENCGGINNTYLTRDLKAGDSYAYVSTTNNGWNPGNAAGYTRYFCLYPPSHPEFNRPWYYTRIGYGDYYIKYIDVVNIGGGELRFTLANYSDVATPFPDIGYDCPAGTAVSNGYGGGTFNYVFYPTTAPYGSWQTHTSSEFTGESRNSSTPFRYATKYVQFLHLINYAVPSGTSPLPIMLFGDVTLKEVK